MAGDQLKRVLVVEDDPQLSMALVQRLRHSGFEAVTATNGCDALNAVRDRSIDIITLDIRLPDMDGFEFASKLRCDPQTEDIPIIIISGKVDRFFREKCLEVRARFFIRKPYDPQLLIHTLKSMLEDDIRKKGTSLCEENSNQVKAAFACEVL